MTIKLIGYILIFVASVIINMATTWNVAPAIVVLIAGTKMIWEKL